MIKNILGIPTFIISLILSVFSIWFMYLYSPSDGICWSNAYCFGRIFGFYLLPCSPILVCIITGYFLFSNKKEEINSIIHITEEEQNISTNSQNDDDSIETKLEKLKSMLNKELITEEEYNAKKQKLIDEM